MGLSSQYHRFGIIGSDKIDAGDIMVAASLGGPSDTPVVEPKKFFGIETPNATMLGVAQTATITPPGNSILSGGAFDSSGFYFTTKAPIKLVRATFQTPSTWVLTDISSEASVQNIANYSLGATFAKGLYFWDGHQLRSYSDMSVLAGTVSLLYQPFTTSTNRGLYRDIVTIDNGVAMSTSWYGGTHVFRYTTAGERIWFEPGVTSHRITYHHGSIFMLGHVGTHIALYGLNLDQEVPLELVQIRPETTSGYVVEALAPGPGKTLLCGISSGNDQYVYQYDFVNDALTQLIKWDKTIVPYPAGDNDTIGALRGLLTFKSKRYALMLTGADDHRVMQIGRDTDTTSTQAYSLTDSAWDFDLPQEEKILTSIIVLHPPSSGSESFTIEYQLNESGTWVSTGAQTPTANTTSTRISLSPPGGTQVKFREIRLRITGPHQLYRVTLEAEVKFLREMWELVLDLYDEDGINHVEGQQRSGEQKRDSLITLARNGETVSFKDGRRYQAEGTTADDNVVVEVVQDSIPKLGEGVMRVRLRKTR